MEPIFIPFIRVVGACVACIARYCDYALDSLSFDRDSGLLSLHVDLPRGVLLYPFLAVSVQSHYHSP